MQRLAVKIHFCLRRLYKCTVKPHDRIFIVVCCHKFASSKSPPKKKILGRFKNNVFHRPPQNPPLEGEA